MTNFLSHVRTHHLKTTLLQGYLVPHSGLNNYSYPRHSFYLFFHALPTFPYISHDPHTQRTDSHYHHHTTHHTTPPRSHLLFASSMSPRTARPILFATLALGLVGFLCWGPSFSGPGSQYYRDLYDGWRSASPTGRSRTLSEHLRAEEGRYVETLKGRQWLIEKHGPRKEEVQS
jgi:hypothetical protein